MTMYNQKFGAERVRSMIPHMVNVGKGEGINFSYGGKVGPTLNSHRLIDWSKKFGEAKQEALLLKIYSYYFEQEKDISDIPTLVKAAEEVGLSGADAFLKTTERASEVKEEASNNMEENGINGVPYFNIGGHGVSGAQEDDYFLQLFRQLGVY